MTLVLEIKGDNALLLGDRSRVIVPKNGLTIGRKSDRDWVLNDPEISGEHAMITCRSGVYHLTDISTNGVYHNHNEQPIGKGCSVKLEAGDKLRIHEYNIFVFEENVSEKQEDNLPPPHHFFTGGVATSETQFPETLDDWGYPEPDLNKAPLKNLLLSDIFQVPVETPASTFISQKFDSEFAPETPASEKLMSGDMTNPDLLKAFFEGLGRSEDISKGQDAMVIMREIGVCFNLMTHWILNTCRESHGNKDLDAALHAILNTSAKDFDLISATHAFSEALANLQTRETPSISGTHSAYNTLLATFDPKLLEKRFDRQGGGHLFIQKKAWYWDEYTKYYQDISDRPDR